MQEFLTCSRPS